MKPTEQALVRRWSDPAIEARQIRAEIDLIEMVRDLETDERDRLLAYGEVIASARVEVVADQAKRGRPKGSRTKKGRADGIVRWDGTLSIPEEK